MTHVNFSSQSTHVPSGTRKIAREKNGHEKRVKKALRRMRRDLFEDAKARVKAARRQELKEISFALTPSCTHGVAKGARRDLIRDDERLHVIIVTEELPVSRHDHIYWQRHHCRPTVRITMHIGW